MGLGTKIKNALHGDDHPNQYEGEQPPGAFPSDSTTSANTKHNTTGTTGTTGTGTHTTGGYSGGTTGTSRTSGTHTGTHSGPHTTSSNTTTGYDDPDGVHGPHGKKTLNKADPRVDSDRDHRGAPGSGLAGGNTTHGTHGTHGTMPGSGLTGSNNTHGTHNTTTGSGLTGNSAYSSNVATGYDDPDGVHGPHGGRAANKVDPRVDSDRDHRGAPGSGLTGNNATHGTRGTHGTHGTHGTTMGSGVTGSNNPYSSNAAATGYDDPDGVHGPHGGRAANKVDPRVDSDRDHRGAPGSGLTGSNNYGTGIGTGHTGGLSSNPHGGATSGIAGNHTTGYDDPDGVHGPHSGRAANKIDPRVDSDRDHRGAPGTHRTTDSGVDVGHNRPYPGDNLRNTQEPYWGDVGRDGQPVTGTHGSLNKDLPLRPNESGIGRGGPQAVGGGTYNAAATHHHDPASSVDRAMEGRDFTHPHQTGSAGVGGAGSDPYSGVHSAAHNPQAALAGGSTSDPYDTRMRDRDMGRDRSGHGAAGAGIGAGVGAGAAVAAGQAAHKHHRDDMHEAGYGSGSSGAGGLNSSASGLTGNHSGVVGGHNSNSNSGIGGHNNTPGSHGGISGSRGGVDDYSRSSLSGNEPGVPKTSMLDPYNNESSTTTATTTTPSSGVRSNVAGGKGGHYGGRSGSPPFNQGTHPSNVDPVPGTTGLGSSSSMGPDHYGPGHEGAKVFHTCARCGEDNDISRYFKKDAVYRMG
ncbi:hypothetical protein CTA1_7656 [Colletotrichum tanaceti]|uniref:Cell surface protein n=1 Tax=Colletotrichum tanaceti TaxID=1306861 RepID=A0A4U6XDD4_9PEZI|nr:hypothetical protein CTA1_7656 [Colletotrichum tanaceti]